MKDQDERNKPEGVRLSKTTAGLEGPEFLLSMGYNLPCCTARHPFYPKPIKVRR